MDAARRLEMAQEDLEELFAHLVTNVYIPGPIGPAMLSMQNYEILIQKIQNAIDDCKEETEQ